MWLSSATSGTASILALRPSFGTNLWMEAARIQLIQTAVASPDELELGRTSFPMLVKLAAALGAVPSAETAGLL